MTRMKINRCALGVASGLTIGALMLTGCGESGSTGTGAESNTVTDAGGTTGPAWVLADAPEGEVSIVDAKGSVSEGDRVVLRGIIGGEAEPMSEGSAVFRVVDTGLYNRCTDEDDHCAKPWDYCCATKEDLVANSATVQVVDATGTPIAESASEFGFSPLDEVVVVGIVGPRPDDRVLTIRATGVHRVN